MTTAILNNDVQNETPVAANVMTWKTFSDKKADEALALWRELHTRLQSANITTHPTWVKSWIDHYGDLVPHRFLIAESAGVVRGIVLITQGVGKKNGPFPIKSVHLGTAGEPQQGSICVEYNRLLVEEGFRIPFTQGLIDAIQNDSGWESLSFDGIDEQELAPWLAMFPQATVRYRDSPYFDLETARNSTGEVISHLGKSTRSNLRRRIKKYGELQTTWATSQSEAEEIFSELIQLHQARWTAVGEAGAFANERFLHFQKQILQRLFKEQKLVLFRIRHDGETVGALLLLVDQNRLLDYLSGFASFEEKPSIGLVTHYLCMQAALERGYDAYDFLVGEKQHKRNLSNNCQQLCWFDYSRPSMKKHAVSTLRKVKHFIGSTSLFS